MKLRLPTSIGPILLLWVLGAATTMGSPVSRLEVRIVTGADELAVGSSLELRIYEAGKSARRLPLVHGEFWPRDSTHLIPVELSEVLDPRNVVRFGLYYRGASSLTRQFAIVSADVELPSSVGTPERLLDATLSGVISRQGELATADREQSALTCKSDADCDDKRTCNGRERCAPRAAGADARGCVKGTPVVCPINQICGEGVGCRGVSDPPKLRDPPQPQDPPPPQGARVPQKPPRP
ncbi:MAG: hypothetical protein ABJC66_04715 [Gammaproteobacteria bacterium]